ncbi:MAG: 1-acyl-sn-glycerol-3-phosphate acyltransferase [Clostridia bacterium]|nr:1-acyl-sn-glycerol-3-phosphate acyltransferase [Clostridia bacterium]
MMFRILYLLCWPIVMLLLRARVFHRERIPKTGFILCANHTSVLDMILLYRPLFRKIHYMAKKEAFKNPLTGWFLRAMGAFPVNRGTPDTVSLKKAMDYLKKGEIVCVFPQGTRHPGEDPKETKVYGGIGMLATHTNTGILPVRICSKGNRTRWLHRNDLVIGSLIEPSDFPKRERNSETYQAIAEKAFEEVCRLSPDE